MNIKDSLIMYASLFEDIWDKDQDLMEVIEWENYEKVIQKLIIMGVVTGRNTYLEAIKEKRNELPF
ncbi:MAG: hypothetical protein V3W20_02865 [Candidatus Neomarinimicrobiota bacterium]